MAVRDADPKRAAKIAEAEAKAEARVAAQEARGVAEAEDALLRNRGLEAELELSPSALSPDEERSLLSPTSAAALRDRRRVEAAFASRPRLERTRAAEAAPREDADARAEVGGETTPALDRADSGAQAELMEALMAEARRDAEAEAEAEAEAKLVEAKKAEAKLAASVERGTSAKLVDAFEVDPVAASLRARPETAPGGHPGAADASFAASFAASVAASVAASGGFEWPPPAPASERQAERDAALERRVRAKMRSFLYSEKEGGPGATEAEAPREEDGILTEGGGEGEGGVAKNARGSAPGVFGTLRRVSRPATAATGGGGFERRREPRHTSEGTTAAEDEARDARAAFEESSDGSGAGGGGSEESESFYSDDFEDLFGDLEDLFASCAEDFEPEEPCP
jgi:hypothetical protein